MFCSGGASTSSGGANSNGGHGLTADELEVSEILLSLPRLIYSTVRWATKKKRSAIKSHPLPDRRLPLPGPAPGSLERMAKSPTTPLDFPDEKSKKIFKRKRTEESREEIVRLEKRQQVDAEALRAKRLELLGLVFNLKLPESETTEAISQKRSAPSASGDDNRQIQSDIHEDELITGLGSPTTVLFPCPISQVGPNLRWAAGSHHPNNACPIGIPDLNLSADEPSQPMDCVSEIRYCKAQFTAVARRGVLMKEKMRRVHHQF